MINKVPRRLFNFISFIVSRRNIIFQEDQSPRCSGVGVPHGGVLSLLLFNLTLREIHKHLPANIRLLQIADDILIYCRSEDVNEALGSLKVAYENLSNWLISLGLFQAPEKSQLCIFHRKSFDPSDWSIELDGNRIAATGTMLYLGILLDSRLSWSYYIIVSRPASAVNVMRMLARVSGGTNPETLLLVHKCLVRATLEWGAILFAGAAKYLLKKLDTQQYASLRVILGCMKSIPTPILLAESNDLALRMRREELLYRNAIRIGSWKNNPVVPRIKLIHEKGNSRSQFPKYAKNIPLVTHLFPKVDLLDQGKHSKRPIYFDYEWVTIETDLGGICNREVGL